MKAIKASVTVGPTGTVELPESVKSQLPRGSAVRVIVLVPEASERGESYAWDRLTAEQFAAGYADADAVYDRV